MSDRIDTTLPSPDPARRQLVNQTREIWEQNAAFWDERLGEGDEFQKHLVAPTVDGLLGLSPGERILEIACGNGSFARHLASLGAEVVATDYSETFIARARKRPPERRAPRGIPSRGRHR